MKTAIRLFLFLLLLWPASVFAQTASLLPMGVSQFFDNNGNPLSAGKVYTYIVGTTTNKTTWTNGGETVTNTNPITLDAGGKAIIYGQGAYRMVVRDRNGNLIWDAVTSSTGAGGGGASTGDGDLVGTIKPWAGIAAPNQYAFAYGQEVSRTTYSVLLTAITQVANVICTSSSNTLTGLSDTTQIRIGAAIESICVAPGTTVASKTSSTVVLSNPSSVSINTTAIFYPFGNGDGSTTFNLPDLRGNTVVGRTNMGGTASTNVTSTYYGTGPDAQGAVGGAQSKALATTNLPAYTPTGTIVSNVTDPGHIHALSNAVNPLSAAAGGVASGANVGGQATIASAVTGITVASAFTGVAQGGAATAFGLIQPSMTLNYIIKITPDTNSAIATGVTSLGGMTGDITCGAGLLCTGNTISITSVTRPGGLDTQVQFNNAGLFDGSANFTWISPVLTIGVASSTTGQLKLTGATSGVVTITPQSIAGTITFTLPNASGTPAISVPSPLSLSATTGAISWAGLTSGGILYASSTTAIASSALLTANQIILGGGAGTAPAALGSLGTTTTLLHGNAGGAPTFGSVVSADLNITTTSCTNQFVTAISAGGVGTCTTDTLASAQHANQGTTTTVLHGNAGGNPSFASVALADMATIAANTVLSNWTAGATVPTANTWPACAADGVHALTYTNGSGVLCTVLTTGGAGTVTSVTQGSGMSFSTTPCTTTCTVSVGSGNKVLLATLTASNSATLADTTSLTSTYNRYEIVFSQIIPATNNVSCRLRYNVGGVQTSGYKSTLLFGQGAATGSNTSTTFILCASSSEGLTNADPGLDAVCSINNPSGAVKSKTICTIGHTGNSDPTISATSVGWYDTNGAVTGIELSMSSGNITSGTVRIYGIVN